MVESVLYPTCASAPFFHHLIIFMPLFSIHIFHRYEFCSIDGKLFAKVFAVIEYAGLKFSRKFYLISSTLDLEAIEIGANSVENCFSAHWNVFLHQQALKAYKKPWRGRNSRTKCPPIPSPTVPMQMIEIAQRCA